MIGEEECHQDEAVERVDHIMTTEEENLLRRLKNTNKKREVMIEEKIEDTEMKGTKNQETGRKRMKIELIIEKMRQEDMKTKKTGKIITKEIINKDRHQTIEGEEILILEGKTEEDREMMLIMQDRIGEG